MKCYIQRRLSGVFSGSLPLMNKAHLYIFAVGLAFVSFQGKFPRDWLQFIFILITLQGWWWWGEEGAHQFLNLPLSNQCNASPQK